MEDNMKPKISLIITDLDNTLFDWILMWHSGFSAMLEKLVKNSGIQQKILEADIQTVFQKHGTSEYAFLIGEIPCLLALHPDEDLTVVYKEAIDAYRIARKNTLKLYPGVTDTLKTLKSRGCMVVAYTESMEFYTMRRIKKLELDGLLDYVYSPPDHGKPTDHKRYYDDSHYTLQHTIQRFTPFGELKPNPHILKKIIQDEGINAITDKTIYIGDSLMKDIAMAQDAGVRDVYAKYGLAQNTIAYEQLRRVTHWTIEEVEREKLINASREVTPSFVLDKSFDQILDLFEFVPHNEKNFSYSLF
jgi:FMN phosphatase YigB (HAD superfamily)